MDSERTKTATKQTWTELALWLREMHSMAKSEVRPSPQRDRTPREKRRVYFACNRHYIGLVIR